MTENGRQQPDATSSGAGSFHARTKNWLRERIMREKAFRYVVSNEPIPADRTPYTPGPGKDEDE